jgi:hypothetical protein
MKGKVLVLCNDFDEPYYTDIDFDETKISAKYTTIDNIEDGSINVILEGSTLTMLRTDELIEFLDNKFK